MATDAPPAPPARTGLPLAPKVVLVVVLIALLPALLVAYSLTGINRDAVEISERQLQAAVLAELATSVTQRVDAIRQDAQAIAAALAYGIPDAEREKAAMASVRALLATFKTMDAVRFEVPEAKISTVIALRGSDQAPPESTAELRAEADRRGMGLAVDGAHGIVVVPVHSDTKVRGYVTALADFSSLTEQLDIVAATRFEGAEVSMLVVDSNRRAVAQQGVRGTPGSDVSGHPIWKVLPDGTLWTARVAVISAHQGEGRRMVGGVETVPELGWAVAIWRPEADAYRTVGIMRQRTLWVVAGALLLALVAGFVGARAITRPVLRTAEDAARIAKRQWDQLSPQSRRGDELGVLHRSIHKMARDLQSGEEQLVKEVELRGALSRFVARDVVDAIVAGEHSLELGGRRATITVLFVDVVAFTPFAEGHEPERSVTMLNELFSVLSEVVFRHRGTVDKFIGDCLMAVWGAPLADDEHATHALRAAEDMMSFVATANDEWRERFDADVRVGIGINSGDAVVGNIGSKKRMEYTVVGDAVNVAARLESLAQPNQVLVGGATRQLVGDTFRFRALGERRLVGRDAPVAVFELDL